jgi:uncharacterized protein (DUF1800 family)
MGNEKLLDRKKFLRSFGGFKKQPVIEPAPTGLTNEPEDPLFKKYARKKLGNRVYTNRVEVPNLNESEAQNVARIGNVTSGIAPYTGTWDIWQATHLLRRTGFGVKKADIEALLALTPAAAVDAICTTAPVTVPSPTPLNYYQTATIIDSGGITLGNSWTQNNLAYANGSNDNDVNFYRQLSLTGWNWGVCINSAHNITEKMTQFWYHFIPVNFDDLRNGPANSSTMSHDYMALLRNYALGNFKTLMKAISKSPAMLVYLSNHYSTATTPNTNFARELFELFTLGKVPTQNYTENDIIEASKVFSGWRVPSFTAAYPFNPGFNPSFHNQSNKVFSATLAPLTNGATINNQMAANGANEFDLLFDMLFTQQATTIAKYICRRLYRFFVYYDIDANVEANVITPLSNVLVTNNWDMNVTVKTLLKSQHFFDAVNKGVMIKSPIDFIAGLIRTLGINTNVITTPANAIANQYTVWNYFQGQAQNNLEQGFGLVPTVSGWKAYYQSPAYYQNWINSNSIQQRASLLNTLIINGTTRGGLLIKFDPIAYVQQFPNATIQDPDLLINAIIPQLFSVDLAASFKEETKVQTLLAGQVTNTYWTGLWSQYLSAPTNATYANSVKTKITQLITTFVQLAEFQLM